MGDVTRVAAAGLLLLASAAAARAEAPRCSNEASTRAISDEASSLFLGWARATNHDTSRTIDAAAVSVKLTNTYETDHGEFTRDCHGHLAISYDGTAPEAEISYRVIQTDDGNTLTQWEHDPQFGQALIAEMILQRALAEQLAKTPNATPEEAAREMLHPQGPGSVAAETRNYVAQHPDMNSGAGRSPALSGGMGPVQWPTR